MARARAWVRFVTAPAGMAHRVPPSGSCTVQDRARAWLRGSWARIGVGATLGWLGRSLRRPGLLATRKDRAFCPSHPAAQPVPGDRHSCLSLHLSLLLDGQTGMSVPRPKIRKPVRNPSENRSRASGCSGDFARRNMLEGGGRGMRRMPRSGSAPGKAYQRAQGSVIHHRSGRPDRPGNPVHLPRRPGPSATNTAPEPRG